MNWRDSAVEEEVPEWVAMSEPVAPREEVLESERAAMLQDARTRIQESGMPQTVAVAEQIWDSLKSRYKRVVGAAGGRSQLPFNAATEEADRLVRLGSAYSQAIAETDTPDKVLPAWLRRGIRGTAITVPEMVAGGVVAGPYGAIGAAMTQEMNQAITEGKDIGMSERELARYVAIQGAVEGLPAAIMQRVGLGGVERVFGKGKAKVVLKSFKDGLKYAGVSTIQEIPEEVVTEIGHSAARQLSGVDPEALSPEQLGQTILDTVVQTVLTVGAVEAPMVGGAAVTGNARATRLQQLRGVREKGFVSAEDAQKLGMSAEEAASRNTRWAAVNKEINQLEAEEGAQPAPVEETGAPTPPPTPPVTPPAAETEVTPPATKDIDAIPDSDYIKSLREKTPAEVEAEWRKVLPDKESTRLAIAPAKDTMIRQIKKYEQQVLLGQKSFQQLLKEPEAAPTAPDLPTFAAKVKEAGRRITTGRWGTDKVWLSDLWNAVKDDPELQGMTRERFNEMLDDANGEDLLNLTKFDLKTAIGEEGGPTRQQVDESVFVDKAKQEKHFIQLEKEDAIPKRETEEVHARPTPEDRSTVGQEVPREGGEETPPEVQVTEFVPMEEGPFDTREEAESFAKSEVGVPYRIVKTLPGDWIIEAEQIREEETTEDVPDKSSVLVDAEGSYLDALRRFGPQHKKTLAALSQLNRLQRSAGVKETVGVQPPPKMTGRKTEAAAAPQLITLKSPVAPTKRFKGKVIQIRGKPGTLSEGETVTGTYRHQERRSSFGLDEGVYERSDWEVIGREPTATEAKKRGLAEKAKAAQAEVREKMQPAPATPEAALKGVLGDYTDRLPNLPERVVRESPIRAVKKARIPDTDERSEATALYDHRTKTLLILDETSPEFQSELENEVIAAWAWENLTPDEYAQWRESAGMPPLKDVKGGVGGGMANVDTFAGSVQRWLAGKADPKVAAFLDKLFATPEAAPKTTGEHRAAAGPATMLVGDVEVEPSAITPTMGKTTEGRKLLKSLNQDSAKPGKWSVGRRTIFEFIARALHSRLIVAQSQVSGRRPGLYREQPHVWFAKSGLDAPTNLHEAGHALLTFLRDSGRLPRGFAAELTAFSELNQPPVGFASAVNPHEGMAELLRLWIADPTSIPDSLRNHFESIVEDRVPGTLNALRDARLAFLYNNARPPIEQWIANINDYRKRGERPPINIASEMWHALAYEVVGPSAAWTWLEKEIWRNMIGPQGIRARLDSVLTREGRKARRNANAVIRDVMKSLQDTPADVKTAQQLTFHVPSIVSNALYGTQEGVKGLRVHQFGEGFNEIPDAEQAIERLRAAGFAIPEGVGHGNWLNLFSNSLQDTKDALGDAWESFLAWGQYKTALYRYNAARAKGKTYQYPMMDTISPEQLETIVSDMARTNPSWEGHYKNLQSLQDQALLLDVLSGEHTVDEVLRMKDEHEDYWTLPRQMENLAMRQGGGTGIHPTSGVRAQHGSQLPFMFEQDGIERKLQRHISAYYDIAAKRAMLRMQEQMRQHPKWKELPFAGRKFVESIMVPLKMDIKLAATLTETELRQMAADAINTYLETEASETLPDELRVKPEDVVLDENNKPIFRHKAPVMANVLSLFDPKKPGERQYFYVPDRLVFYMQAQKQILNVENKLLPTLRIGREITEPFKRELVQNLAFSIRNPPRDVTTGVLFAEDVKELIPGLMHAVGFVADSVGTDAGERMAAELISHSMEGVHHEQHRGIWGSFVGAMREGVVIPGYRDMTFPQRLARFPGQAASVMLKEITFLNWLTFGRYASNKGEVAGRAGAYTIARKGGKSAAAAQSRFDASTGNFTQHTRNRALAELWRMLGFFNPAWQISWQMYDQALHPDPKVRQMFYGVKIPIIAAMGSGMAAATYLGAMAWIAATSKDDEEKKRRQEEWRQRQRNRSNFSRARYFEAMGLQLPFEYGIVGAVQSAAYNASMDAMLDGKVSGDRMLAIAEVRTPTVKDVIGDFVIGPMQFKTGVELALNYRFFFQDQVVDQRLKDMYPDNPELQTWPDTPELYKTAGRSLGVSPEQLRHATRGLMTSLGDDLVATASRGFGDEPKDWPLIGRLAAREPRGFFSQPVKNLRELIRERNGVLATIKDSKRRGVDYSGLEEQVKQLTLAECMNSLIDDAWQEAKDAATPEIRMQKEREMTDLAARFFELVQGKTTDKELKEKLGVSVMTAYKNVNEPKPKKDESDEDFQIRQQDVATRRERLYVAISGGLGESFEQAVVLLQKAYDATDTQWVDPDTNLATKAYRDRVAALRELYGK